MIRERPPLDRPRRARNNGGASRLIMHLRMRALPLLLLRTSLLAAALIVYGCSTQHSVAAPAQASTPPRSPDRFIYVAAGDIPTVCYHDLGSVSFQEPFTDAAMDGDNVRMANKLRDLAMLKYPDSADAVIDVRSEQNAVGTIVTVTGEVVELRQGQHTMECAMRKAPGVINTAAAVAAGGLFGAAIGGIAAGGTAGFVAGGALGAGAAGGYMAVDRHLETKREQTKLKAELDTQQAEIARLLAERSSLQKCADEETPLADCKIQEAAATPGTPQHSEGPSYEQEQPQFEVQKQVQQQQAYIRKLRDQVFELQQQLRSSSAPTSGQ